MGISLFDGFKPSADSTEVKKPTTIPSLYDGFDENGAVPPSGLIDWWKNFLVNGTAMFLAANPQKKFELGQQVTPVDVIGGAVGQTMKSLNVFSPSFDQKVDAAGEALFNTNDATKLTINDFIHFFGKTFDDTAASIKAIHDSYPDFWEGIKANPGAAGGALVRGFVEPITDLVESTYGVMLTDDNGVIRPLTAEERGHKIKNVVATGVMVAAEVGLLKAMSPTAKSLESLGSAKMMAETVKVTTKGEIAKGLMKNMVAAGVSGTAYGATRYANEEDQLNEMIINGVLFAPLGLAIDAMQIGGRKASAEARKKAASAIANLRQTQAIAENSISDGVKMLEQFQTADDMVDALVNKSVVLDKKDITLIRGISEQKFIDFEIQRKTGAFLVNPVDMSHLDFFSFKREDGTYDVVFKDMSSTVLTGEHEKFFRRTGYLPDQMVSYNGRGEYRLVEVKPSTTIQVLSMVQLAENINAAKAGLTPPHKAPSQFGDAVIQDIKTGKLMKVHHSTISHLTRVEMGNPNFEVQSSQRLKTRVLREVEARKQTGGYGNLATDKENIANIDKAVTGQPVSVIGYRYTRGALIPGTPRFYAITYDQVSGYQPSSKGLGSSTKRLTKKEIGQFFNVHRMNFQNPLILKSRTGYGGMGSHERMIQWIKDNQYNLGVTDKVIAGLDAAMNKRGFARFNEVGWPILDREIKRIVGGAGYDGIITSSEILDIRGTAAIDLPEPSKVAALRFAPAVQSHFMKRLYTNWKQTVLGQKVDAAQYFDDIFVARHTSLDELDIKELKAVKKHVEKLKAATTDTIEQDTHQLRLTDIDKQIEYKKLSTTIEGRIQIRKQQAEEDVASTEFSLENAKKAAAAIAPHSPGNFNPYEQTIKTYERDIRLHKERARITGLATEDLEKLLESKTNEYNKLQKEVYNDPKNKQNIDRITAEQREIDNLIGVIEVEINNRAYDADSLSPATVARYARRDVYFDLIQKANYQFYNNPNVDVTANRELQASLQAKTDAALMSHDVLRDNIAETKDFIADPYVLPGRKAILEKRLAVYQEELRIRNEEDIHYVIDNHEADPDPGENFNFNKSIADFAKQRGLSAEEIPLLKREFESQLWTEFGNGEVDADDVAILSDIRDRMGEEIAADSKLASDAKNYSSKQLAKAANANGMYVDWEDAGRVTLRDMETGNVLYTTNKYEEARTFIRDSAQKNGVDLGSDFGVPPTNGDFYTSTSGDFPDPNPSVFPPSSRVRDIFDSLNLAVSLLVPHRQIALSFDGLYKTEFFAKVFAPLQEAKKKVNALVRPHYDRLIHIEELVLGMGKAEREMIGHYMETMSPDEVATKLMSRPMTDVEKHWGQRLADMNIDMGRVFEYRRAIKNILDDLDAGAELDADLKTKVEEAKKAFNIDDVHQQAADLFGEILLMNRSEASLGAITRYARSLKGDGTRPEMTRAEFRKANNMTDKQIVAADRLEAFYRDLAKEFGIPDTRQLSGFMTHARLYNDGDIKKAMEHFSGDIKVKDFYAKMARTGEISAYEKDPIRAMQRYIKAGYDATHLNQAIVAARAAIKAEVNAVKPDGSRKIPVELLGKVDNTMGGYIDEIQGHIGESQKATQRVVDDLFQKFHIQTSLDIRKKVVNNILATFEAGAQGAKVAAGLRDFTFGLSLAYAKYGAKVTKDIVEFGIRGLDGIDSHELERLGIINVASPVQFSDPVDAASTQIGRTAGKITKNMSKVNDVLFTLSGQKDVYRTLHTGVYLAIFKNTGDNLRLFRDKKISPDEFRRRIKLGTYQDGIVREFEKVLDNGNDEQTARFLATQAGYEVVGYYGIANHAPLFRSNMGKLAGQFGSWSLWYVGVMQQLASRGTMRQRLGALTRFGAAHVIVMSTLGAAGFDAGSWNPIGGLFFGGGPLLDQWQSVSDAASGYGYKQREGRARLRRLLPYDPWANASGFNINPMSDQRLNLDATNGRFNTQQLYLPGSSGIANLVKSMDAAQRGHNPVAVVGQAAGIRIDETERSALDRMLGNRPRLLGR